VLSIQSTEIGSWTSFSYPKTHSYVPESICSSDVFSSELRSSNHQVKLTRYNTFEYCCRNYFAGNVDSQEDNDKEDKHTSRSLIHDFQPSNHDDLHHVLVELISSRLDNLPPNMAVTTKFATLVARYRTLPETRNQ
jgi:hypothetical protein